MRDFCRMEMQRLSGGYGVEIPCAEVMAPRVQYYIVAFDRDGAPMGFAGSAEEPFSVPIVTDRTQPPPALPGQAPPQQCTESECPPGMPGCESGRGNAGLGDTCMETRDCRAGLSCDDNFCVAEEGGGGGGEDGDGLFDGLARIVTFDVGFTFGLGYASAGSEADSAPPEGMEGELQYGAYIPAGAEDCDLTEGYCVQLNQPGFVPTYALRLGFNVNLGPRFLLGGTFRYQFGAGEGSLSSILLGLRAGVNVIVPQDTGARASVFLGTSFGQIQLQPPQLEGQKEPYIISGLNGVQLGGTFGYWFTENVGFYATPEIHLLFPTFMFGIDITAGLSFGF
ncbi:MAG: hypothetical protein CMH59_01830 [Myxococcales bacterium]|nr:hypothetical protein [Myxococcales bacterium]